MSVSCKTNDSTHRFIPPIICFSRLLYFSSLCKRALNYCPESSLILYFVFLFLDYIDHFVNILLAGIMVKCFHHNTNGCLNARLVRQNVTSIAQSSATLDTVTVLCHVLVNIFVAHSGLGIVDTLLIESLVQTKVGYDCCDHNVGQQFATLFHICLNFAKKLH